MRCIRIQCISPTGELNEMIGKFEELTLMACLRVGQNGVPSDIYSRLLEGQHEVAFGAIYTTLNRLADKRLLDRGTLIDDAGRRRKTFTINGAGRAALSEAVNATAKIGGFSVPGGFDAIKA